jgi:SAM-dependent methyltransferase
MSANKTVQRDFDRIAMLSSPGWNHNEHYHDFLLRFLPAHIERALDLGCRTGCFARLLAARANHVTAIDISPNMISVARRESTAFPNISFTQADAEIWDWPVARFDCIASIATLHHLPLEDLLPKIKLALRPGGVLLVLDIRRTATPSEHLLRIPALATAVLLRLARTRTPRPSAEVRRIWKDHGARDRYLSVAEARTISAATSSGATP